jgi:hypothetical protein
MWSLVELQLYQIFSIVTSLTVAQQSGGWSADAKTSEAILDAVDGWRLKLEVITAALNAALVGLDDEATDILNSWAVEKVDINNLHKCRSKLAHWRAETLHNLDATKTKVRIAPPFHSNKSPKGGFGPEGAWETDVNHWHDEFQVAGRRLSLIAERLAAHKGLQRKFVEQAASQILPVRLGGRVVGGDPMLIELLRQRLSGHL